MCANDESQDQELYASATILGSDEVLTDISYASPAQSEVMMISDKLPSTQAAASLADTPLHS